MPRTLKRRSDAISRDNDEDDRESPDPVQVRTTNTTALNNNTNRRRRRSSSVSSGPPAAADSDLSDQDAQAATNTQNTDLQLLTKKFIRLALSSEYSRVPLRRTDITQKIFKESNAPSRLFKPVFTAAQTQLQEVFGMQMVELPSKEKTSLKDRRTQQTQTQTAASGGGNKSWILVSTLSPAYKTHPVISQPGLNISRDTEATYTALYTFILSLIYLNNSSLPEAKMERYLKRVHTDTYTPLGSLEKLLTRMTKEGYVEKKRELISGEEVVEYVPGPRGKVEVGVDGVAGLVKTVYGHGAVDLNGKITGSHANVAHGADENNGDIDEEDRQNHDEDADEETGDNDNADNVQTTRAAKIDKDDLEERLKRSLGLAVMSSTQPNGNGGGGTRNGNSTNPARRKSQQQHTDRPRQSRRGRNVNNDGDDDDDDDDEEDDAND